MVPCQQAVHWVVATALPWIDAIASTPIPYTPMKSAKSGKVVTSGAGARGDNPVIGDNVTSPHAMSGKRGVNAPLPSLHPQR